MKKSGFTLIEVLGVVVLLGILVLIAVPAVNSVLNKNEDKAYNMIISNIESSAKNWASDNPTYLPEDEGECITITLGYLKQGNYAENKIINPKTDKEISNTTLIKITRKSNNYVFKVELGEGENNKDDLLLPQIILKGETSIEVSMNKPYVDPGYYATSYGEDITSKVELTYYKEDGKNFVPTSSLDTSAEITYKVVYSATNNYGTNSVSRIVRVGDTKPPVIDSITGNPTEWVSEATLVVTAHDDGSGLHTEAYSFDGGTTWQASNTKKINASGTYVIKVRDAKENVAEQSIVVSYVQLEDINIVNKDESQTVVIPADGTYKLEVWGAKGDAGANGGYISGSIYLKKGTTLTVITGGMNGYNGGGAGTNKGGGATVIKNGTAVLITGAGGGGGTGATIGGSGNGAGGPKPDGCGSAASAGTNGGGGGGSASCSFVNTCSTSACGTYKCNCSDRYYNNVGGCPGQCTSNINNYGSGCSCTMGCYYYSWCNNTCQNAACGTTTRAGIGGNGGTSSVGTGVTQITKTDGNNDTNGYAKISMIVS